jgi:hypothetical protein
MVSAGVVVANWVSTRKSLGPVPTAQTNFVPPASMAPYKILIALLPDGAMIALSSLLVTLILRRLFFQGNTDCCQVTRLNTSLESVIVPFYG